MIFKHSFKNIAPSAYLLKAFMGKGYSEVLYIPNTIELPNYTFKRRQNLEPKLLWVRSFTTIYNPAMAVKVLQELKKEYPNASLCMVGPDKDGTLDKIKEMVRHLKLNVTFTGKLSKKDWISLSENYDIFINTTHFDNTPVSVIEAMALGLPIVSTNVGGITYLLTDKETALLVEDNDVTGMVNAIKEILSNTELKDKMVVNALNLVQDFDWEKVKKKWIDILK